MSAKDLRYLVEFDSRPIILFGYSNISSLTASCIPHHFASPISSIHFLIVCMITEAFFQASMDTIRSRCDVDHGYVGTNESGIPFILSASLLITSIDFYWTNCCLYKNYEQAR